MKLEHAIATAIKYETRVHAMYAEAEANAEHEVARRVFATLCAEEKAHIRYLRRQLEEWRASCVINLDEIAAPLGSRVSVEEGAARLRATVGDGRQGGGGPEVESLRKALAAERETSDFYRQMVATLDDDGKRLFERFVEIEEGHLAIVQAEIDLVTGSGVWFDTADFSRGSG